MEVPLKVVLAQYPSGRDPAEIVAEAKAAAAEIVVFPEMYSNGYAHFDPDDAVARARWCAAAENLSICHWPGALSKSGRITGVMRNHWQRCAAPASRGRR
jgi:hypothetical protein